MSDILKESLRKWNNYLNESSLSRLWCHMEEHDTAFISAERSNPAEGLELQAGKKRLCIGVNSAQLDNGLRTRDLEAALLARGYGVTRVSGNYIENFQTPSAVEVTENSFFVVNLKDADTFLANLRSLSEYFCQDSVLLVPRGENGYLLGTNATIFPGYGAQADQGRPVFGETGEFLTRVKNRPLVFKNRPLVVKETQRVYEDLSRLERMAVKAINSKIII